MLPSCEAKKPRVVTFSAAGAASLSATLALGTLASLDSLTCLPVSESFLMFLPVIEPGLMFLPVIEIAA